MELAQGGFLNPEVIVRNLNLSKPGMSIADFGCGAGYFSIPLARLVRPRGEVFAVDILDAALDAVRSRAKSEGLFNINIIKGDLEKERGSDLKDESQDVVFVSNTLYQARDKEAVAEEARRVLKHAGKLVIIDWLPDSPIGPPGSRRVSPVEARRIAQAKDFTFNGELKVDDLHYGLLFTK